MERGVISGMSPGLLQPARGPGDGLLFRFLPGGSVRPGDGRPGRDVVDVTIMSSSDPVADDFDRPAGQRVSSALVVF